MTTLITDNWNGRLNREEIIENPSVERIMECLNALDQKKHTCLVIETNKNKSLTVGGGLGKYVVYASNEREQFYTLVNDRDQDKFEILNIGGQEGDYSKNMVVDLTVASHAIGAFVNNDELDKRYCWQEE